MTATRQRGGQDGELTLAPPTARLRTKNKTFMRVTKRVSGFDCKGR